MILVASRALQYSPPLDPHPSCAYDLRIINAQELPMLPAYDIHAPKRAANLSVNGDLLQKARELEINLSATLEEALAEAVRKKRAERWLAENRNAMEAYNEYVEAHGAFSDGLRSF